MLHLVLMFDSGPEYYNNISARRAVELLRAARRAGVWCKLYGSVTNRCRIYNTP